MAITGARREWVLMRVSDVDVAPDDRVARGGWAEIERREAKLGIHVGAALLLRPDASVDARLASFLRRSRFGGSLTIVGLAQEANVKRHVLTHRHTDLKDEFNARVRAQRHVSPQLAVAHDRNDLLQRRLDAALEDNRRLSEQVHALARQLNLTVSEADEHATRSIRHLGAH